MFVTVSSNEQLIELVSLFLSDPPVQLFICLFVNPLG